MRRLIAQSLAIAYTSGTQPATERDPLADESPTQRDIVKGVRALEGKPWQNSPRALFFATLCCTVLALGTLKVGPFADAVRKREQPAGKGVFSFVHVKDAARAAMLAIDWPAGVFNIADDEPAARHRMAAALCCGNWSTASGNGRARR